MCCIMYYMNIKKQRYSDILLYFDILIFLPSHFPCPLMPLRAYSSNYLVWGKIISIYKCIYKPIWDILYFWSYKQKCNNLNDQSHLHDPYDHLRLTDWLFSLHCIKWWWSDGGIDLRLISKLGETYIKRHNIKYIDSPPSQSKADHFLRQFRKLNQ